MNDAKPTAIDMFRKLDRSNCGECGVPSCFGFAALVIKGDKRVEDCPMQYRNPIPILQTLCHLGARRDGQVLGW